MVVDDEALMSDCLSLALKANAIEHTIAVAGDELTHDAVLAAADRFRPDVVLLDLFLGSAGLAIPLIRPLTAKGARVLVVTAFHDDHLLAQCLVEGAVGLFDKCTPFEELANHVIDAALGRTVLSEHVRDALLSLLQHGSQEPAPADAFSQLTQTESEVLSALIEGWTADRIALERSVALTTVRTHIRSILHKLDVNSQLAAVALARRAGWAKPSLSRQSWTTHA